LRATIAWLCLGSLLLAGCASIGPPTIARDRLDYDHAVTTSWKRMMLLNLVKLRYGDTPMFLDVASIINSYTLEAQVNLGATWAASPGWDTGTLGARGTMPTSRRSPTTRSWGTVHPEPDDPDPAGVVLSLIQSGWAADTVLQIMVSSINGVQNRFGGGARAARPSRSSRRSARRCAGSSPPGWWACGSIKRRNTSGP